MQVRVVCCIAGVCVYKLISVLVGSMSNSKAVGAIELSNRAVYTGSVWYVVSSSI